MKKTFARGCAASAFAICVAVHEATHEGQPHPHRESKTVHAFTAVAQIEVRTSATAGDYTPEQVAYLRSFASRQEKAL